VSKIHVAVGVILTPDKQILLSKRPDKAHQGGKWEFPGGKVEPHETVEIALARELFEELDIHIQEFEPLCLITHDYGDKQVLLDTFIVKKFDGIARGKELQPVAFYGVDQLRYVEFPEANVAICHAIEKWFTKHGW
jgi:8-oxo-dGTP diphosphatase